MKRKGISLIVLIITIVVIIILATAIIVNLAQTNIIKNSEEAVFKQDMQTYKDELSLYIADKFTDKQGEYDPKLLNADLNGITYNGEKVEGTIKDIISLSKKYEDKITIVNGKLMVDKEKATEEEIKWFEEIGIESTKKEEGKDDVGNEEPREDETEQPSEPQEPIQVELKDASEGLKIKYNFATGTVNGSSTAPLANTIVCNSIEYTTADVAIANEDLYDMIIYFEANSSNSFPGGYYKYIATTSGTSANLQLPLPDGDDTNAWKYIGESYTVTEEVVTLVELKDASEDLKVTYNFATGTVNGSPTAPLANTIVCNGIEYTTADVAIANEDLYDMIIYFEANSSNSFPGGYYKYIATTSGTSANLQLPLPDSDDTSAWKFLTTSYKVVSE